MPSFPAIVHGRVGSVTEMRNFALHLVLGAASKTHNGMNEATQTTNIHSTLNIDEGQQGLTNNHARGNGASNVSRAICVRDWS